MSRGQLIRRARGGHCRLPAADPEAGRGEPEEVHRLRTSTRRLRSELRTVSDLVDGEWGEHLEQELKSLSAVLGSVRDLDIFVNGCTRPSPLLRQRSSFGEPLPHRASTHARPARPYAPGTALAEFTRPARGLARRALPQLACEPGGSDRVADSRTMRRSRAGGHYLPCRGSLAEAEEGRTGPQGDQSRCRLPRVRNLPSAPVTPPS